MTPTDRIVERLGRLVATETPSSDAERLMAAHRVLRAWGDEAFGRAGEVRVVEGVPHLLWRSGAERPVLLLGHVDTVFPVGTVDRRPFAVDGDRATGPGVFDMKSGLVIALEAVARAAGTEHVSMLITGDEEVGSPTSRALVEEMAAGCAAVLVLEPSLDGALKTGRKGAALYRIAFEGRAAHAGIEPERGHNALTELVRLVTWCEGVADPARGTTVTPTVAAAGTAVNVVPDTAELRLDVRATSTAELERVHAALLARPPIDQGVRVTVGGGINRPPLEPLQAERLVALARHVSSTEGLPEIDTAAVGGGSDGNFTAAMGVPTLDGLGPVGGGAHADHEWVSISSMRDRVRLVCGMIDALASPTGKTPASC
jgi:glutamate carboxypeptidase